MRRETTGSVKAMMQLMPLKIDKVGAASVLSGNERYEMADNVQVYLWYKGQYYPTKLAQVDADGYHRPAGTITSAALPEKRSASSLRSRTTDALLQRPEPHTAAAALGALPAPLPFFVIGCWGTSLPARTAPMGWQSCAVHPPCGCAAPSTTWGGWMGQPRPYRYTGLVRRAVLRAKYQGRALGSCGAGRGDGPPALWQRDQNVRL